MSTIKSASIDEVQKLERDNAKLKKQLGSLGTIGHDAIRTLRAITLRKENEFLRQLFISIGKVPEA